MTEYNFPLLVNENVIITYSSVHIEREIKKINKKCHLIQSA